MASVSGARSVERTTSNANTLIGKVISCTRSNGSNRMAVSPLFPFFFLRFRFLQTHSFLLLLLPAIRLDDSYSDDEDLRSSSPGTDRRAEGAVHTDHQHSATCRLHPPHLSPVRGCDRSDTTATAATTTTTPTLLLLLFLLRL